MKYYYTLQWVVEVGVAHCSPIFYPRKFALFVSFRFVFCLWEQNVSKFLLISFGGKHKVLNIWTRSKKSRNRLNERIRRKIIEIREVQILNQFKWNAIFISTESISWLNCQLVPINITMCNIHFHSNDNSSYGYINA